MPGKEVFGHIVVGQHPSDSRSSRLHVDIFWFCCFHSFDEVYSSIDSSEMMGISPAEVSNFNCLVISQTQPVPLQLTASSSRTL